MNLISLFVSSILTNNILLNKFLGVELLDDKKDSNKHLIINGIFITIILLIANIFNYLTYKYILIATKTEYMAIIVFILLITIITKISEAILKKHFTNLYDNMDSYFINISTNTLVLGLVLLNIFNQYNLIETIIYSIGSGIGYLVIIYIYSTIKERMTIADIPSGFKGLPIALITMGIIALIFARYMGV